MISNKNKLFILPLLLLSIQILGLTQAKAEKLIGAGGDTPSHTARSPQVLFKQLTDSAFRCNWIAGKVTAVIIQDKKSTSFNANVRIRQDSLIWLTVSLGIEVIRGYVSQDSLKLIDRVNSKYLLQDPDYLEELINVPLDYDMLQALLMGNYFPYLDGTKLKTATADKDFYILSTPKWKLMRSKEEKEKDPIKMEVWMIPQTSRVAKLYVEDVKNKKKLQVQYSDYKLVEGKLFPFKIDIKTEDKKSIEIKLEFSKLTANKPQTFPFTIPADYQKMNN
jgi:hypothetical protein